MAGIIGTLPEAVNDQSALALPLTLWHGRSRLAHDKIHGSGLKQTRTSGRQLVFFNLEHQRKQGYQLYQFYAI
jgi:hypothetical protein